jgi:hypothetical protein
MAEPFAMPHANYMLSILQGPPLAGSFRDAEFKAQVWMRRALRRELRGLQPGWRKRSR